MTYAPIAPTTPSAPHPVTISDAPEFAYHRLLRTHPRYRWWRGLLVLVVAASVYMAMVVTTLVPTLIASEVVPGLEELQRAGEDVDFTDPVSFASGLLVIALMLPAVVVAGLICRGARSHVLAASVAGRLRWRLLARCTGWALVVLLPIVVATIMIDADLSNARWDQRALTMVVLTLLLIPVQAAAEEYVFRGLSMQVIGAWLRHPAFAILLPVPFFVLGHGYDIYGQADVAVFAILAGWLTWRTGGLEAAIALHVVNNMVLMLAAAIGLLDPNATEGSLIGVLISVGISFAYAALVVTLVAPGFARTAIITPAEPARTPSMP